MARRSKSSLGFTDKKGTMSVSYRSPAREEFIINAGRFKLELGKRTLIMGIVNITPDSFSGDGLYKRYSIKSVLMHIDELIRDGADIIDIGGESTRPGSEPISVRQEINRIIPIIKNLARRINVPISVDTYKAEVAKEALYAGASLVNDIMGLRGNSAMARVVAEFDAPIILMHIKGKPRTMQHNPRYRSLISEIRSELYKSVQKAVEFGIDKEKTIIDPGIGFGKTPAHNLQIISRLSELKSLDRPILIGCSRKSFIGNILNLPVQERLMGTAASVALAIAGGAHIVRVHDVKLMRQVAEITDAVIGS
jgi:dihydropteroate synthase